MEVMRANRVWAFVTYGLVVASILLFASSTPLAAQQYRHEFGVLAEFDYGIHASSFRGIGGVPSCCPEYGTTAGVGYLVGLEYNRQLTDNIGIAGRILISSSTVDFISDETVLLSIDGDTEYGTFEHTLGVSLTAIGIEPLTMIRIFPNLFAFAGFNASFPISATYEQQETITSPDYGIFAETGTNVRNRYSGDIPDTAEMLVSGVAGIRMRIPLSHNGTHALYPEVSYRHSFNNTVDGMSWKPHAFRVGIVLTMGI